MKGVIILREYKMSEKTKLEPDEIKKIKMEYRQIYEKALIRKGGESALSVLPYLLPMVSLYLIALIMNSTLCFESVVIFTFIFGAILQSILLSWRFKKYKCLNMRDIVITILVLVIGLMMLHVKSI